MIQVSTLGPMCGQNVHFSKFAPPGNDYSFSRFRTEVHRLFDLYDERLSDREYVCGADYTIADIAAFPWLRNYEFLGITLAGRPHLARYVEKVSARPAVKTMLSIIAGIKSSRDTAPAEVKDRVFGRGQYARA